MIATQSTLQQKAQILLDVLQQDVRHIEQSLTFLNRLRCLLIKRDEQGLKALLREIQQENKTYRDHEQRRDRLRQELATLTACLPTEVTLSHLETYLESGTRRDIRQCKHQLIDLTRRLQSEVRATALLLHDLMRFNHMLFKAIFQSQETPGTTYGINGSLRQDGRIGMLNLTF